MPFSSKRSLPPRCDSTSTMQLAATLAAGVSSSMKVAVGVIAERFLLACLGLGPLTPLPIHFFRLLESNRKHRQTRFTPRRPAISAAARHSSSGSRVRLWCWLRNSSKRLLSSSTSSKPLSWVTRIIAWGLPPSADASKFRCIQSRTLTGNSRCGGNWLYGHEFRLMFRMLSLEAFWIPNDNRINGLWHPNRGSYSRTQPKRDHLLIKAGARQGHRIKLCPAAYGRDDYRWCWPRRTLLRLSRSASQQDQHADAGR